MKATSTPVRSSRSAKILFARSGTTCQFTCRRRRKSKHQRTGADSHFVLPIRGFVSALYMSLMYVNCCAYSPANRKYDPEALPSVQTHYVSSFANASFLPLSKLSPKSPRRTWCHLYRNAATRLSVHFSEGRPSVRSPEEETMFWADWPKLEIRSAGKMRRLDRFWRPPEA